MPYLPAADPIAEPGHNRSGAGCIALQDPLQRPPKLNGHARNMQVAALYFGGGATHHLLDSYADILAYRSRGCPGPARGESTRCHE